MHLSKTPALTSLLCPFLIIVRVLQGPSSSCEHKRCHRNAYVIYRFIFAHFRWTGKWLKILVPRSKHGIFIVYTRGKLQRARAAVENLHAFHQHGRGQGKLPQPGVGSYLSKAYVDCTLPLRIFILEYMMFST